MISDSPMARSAYESSQYILWYLKFFRSLSIIYRKGNASNACHIWLRWCKFARRYIKIHICNSSIQVPDFIGFPSKIYNGFLYAVSGNDIKYRELQDFMSHFEYATPRAWRRELKTSSIQCRRLPVLQMRKTDGNNRITYSLRSSASSEAVWDRTFEGAAFF